MEPRRVLQTLTHTQSRVNLHIVLTATTFFCAFARQLRRFAQKLTGMPFPRVESLLYAMFHCVCERAISTALHSSRLTFSYCFTGFVVAVVVIALVMGSISEFTCAAYIASEHYFACIVLYTC